MFREMLSEASGGTLQVRWARDLARAGERLTEGRFDVILLDLGLPDCSGLEAFARVHEAAPAVPVIILSGQDDEKLALRVVRVGAEDCLMKSSIDPESLLRSVRYTVERAARRRIAATRQSQTGQRARVLAFWGAKGGVGVSTVAANTAAALAGAGKRTIAVELRSYQGSLAHYLGAANVHADISSVLQTPAEQIGPDQLKARLTRYTANLALLAAPQQVNEYQPVSAAHARVIVQSLSAMAEIVVVDLPPEPCDAVREALRLSEYVGLVLDRESACVAAAGLAARRFRKWGLDVPAGLVVVQRSPVACPVDLESLAEKTGLAISELIPPAPDACIAAAREGVPLVEAYHDALIGSSLLSLARNLAADPIVIRKPA